MSESITAAETLSFIHPAEQRQIARFEIFSSLPSTNSYLLDLAKKTQVSGCVCVAEEQTEGRGRQGKQWISPRGNVYCSLLWNFPVTQTDISHLSLAVGVMLVRVLHKLGVQDGVQLKWPNDIYFANRKLAGILIEAIPARREGYPVVIGVGLNIHSGATDMQIGLAEILGQSISLNKVLGVLLNELIASLPCYISQNFSTFINDYTKYDMLRGKYIVIRQQALEIAGIAQGVNLAGELGVRDQNGKLHLFRCGEVSVVLNYF